MSIFITRPYTHTVFLPPLNNNTVTYLLIVIAGLRNKF